MKLVQPCQDSELEEVGSWQRRGEATWGLGAAVTSASGEDGCYSDQSDEGGTRGTGVDSY